VALELNVTAVGATEPTFITIWNNSGSRPLTSSLNPAPGEPPTPNAVTVKLYDGGFSIYNKAGNVDLVIDVTGYYTTNALGLLGARISALEDARPQTYLAYDNGPNSVTDYETITYFKFDRPYRHPGLMTVNYEASVHEPDIGESVECTIGNPAPHEVETWVSDGADGQISGNRIWEDWAEFGGSVNIELRCASSDAATITSAQLWATFVPRYLPPYMPG